MKKKIFKDNLGNIHFGINAPDFFQEGTREDIKNALDNLGDKRLWRCHVCNDLSISINPIKECPTCHALDAYIEIDADEFNNLFEIL